MAAKKKAKKAAKGKKKVAKTKLTKKVARKATGRKVAKKVARTAAKKVAKKKAPARKAAVKKVARKAVPKIAAKRTLAPAPVLVPSLPLEPVVVTPITPPAADIAVQGYVPPTTPTWGGTSLSRPDEELDGVDVEAEDEGTGE